MKKRTLSWLIALCLIVSLVGGISLPAAAVTQSQVENWMNAQIGKPLDMDGKWGAQCVDAFNYYLRDVWGIADPIGMYPVKYAYQIFDYNVPSGWQKISGAGNYRVGDVVIWAAGNGSTTGHVGMVYSVNGSNVQILQQNYNKEDTCQVHAIHWTNLIRGVFRPPLEIPQINYASMNLGRYLIKNNGNGEYLCVANSGTANNIVTWERNGYTYEFEMEIQAAGQGYRIKPTCTSGTTNVLNVDANTVVSGNNVNHWSDGNNATQWWGFQAVNGGYVIRNMQNPSVCLSIGNGHNVVVSTYTGAATQIWSLERSPLFVTGVALNQTSASIRAGKTIQLTANVTPDTAANKAVIWSSDHPEIARVDTNGVVTGVNRGTAIITVTTAEGNKTATCTVQVKKSKFIDVPDDTWYTEAVDWAVDHNITSGVSETLFAPDESCTRGQIVTFLWRNAGKVTPEIEDHPFVDAAPNEYYHPAVIWAYQNGITVGTDAKHFSPFATVTRAQVVTFLWRASGQPTPGNTSTPFVDVPSNAYYATAVRWAVESSITNGVSATEFAPDAPCTRAQVVTFLYRAQ